MICLDKIQRTPNIFPILRGVIDRNRRNGQFLILGSASRDLIRQSEDYIRTFLERDIPQLGFRIPANTLGSFWNSIETIAPDQTVVIAPVEGEYPIADHVMVMPLHAFVNIAEMV